MLTRTFTFLFALLFATAAFAFGKNFTQADFDQARDANKPILVMVHANWCPTCRAQEAVIKKLSAQPEFSSFVFLRIDYDTQPGFVRAFRVPRQSALLVYKGHKGIARSLGETNEEVIAAMLRKAL
jgi:thioredoxin-like negative regulator of GroEL